MGINESLPEYREWSLAAVRLLQGVVYLEDHDPWNLLLAHKSKLEDYFARIGLALVVEEAEGFAFLRQLDEEEVGEGYDRLPKLFRKSALGYEPTLLCVLLRDELRRNEERELDNQRCVVRTELLFEQWRAFFPASFDEVKLKRSLSAALAKLEELKYVREFGKEPEEWEIRRIIKARVPVEKLEGLVKQLRLAQTLSSPTVGGEVANGCSLRSTCRTKYSRTGTVRLSAASFGDAQLGHV